MKVAKYILAVITLLLSVYAFIDKRILFGIMLLAIGALILPPISDKLKEKFSFWKNRIVRYVSLFILLMIGATNLPPARDTTIINYIQKETNDKALNELKKLESVGNDLGSSSAMANPKEFLNKKGKNTMVFDPKFDFSKATNYLKEDNENGAIQNLVVEFEFDSNNSISSKRTIITYSKKGEVTYPNNEIPAISTLIDYQAMETYKKILAQEKERAKEEERLNKQQAEEQDKKKKLLATFETCDFVGQKSYIIPDLNGANLYTVLQSDFGFTVSKNFKNGVDYFCTKEMPRKFDYKVNIIGCSPSEIIGVTAAAIDYGIGQNGVMGFIRYIAISTCRENDVEVVRNWVEANIGNESSETTIGGITFLLSHSGRSTTLQVSVEEKNILAN